MIKLKTTDDIKYLQESGRRLATVLTELVGLVKAGVVPRDLDDRARELIRDLGDKPAFLNYRPAGSALAYPTALCVSVNNEIVHGIPGKRVIKDGDIVTLDLGLNHQGYFSDMAISVAVGRPSPETEKLLRITHEALKAGIEAARPGRHIGDIGAAIAGVVKSGGGKIIRELAGHGVGFAVHEDPLVPNDGQAGQGLLLKPGLVLALEPMVTFGRPAVRLLDDGFTFVTKDGSISAHFEHTVLITNDKPIILTQYE
ncbi:MAG: type I methionyl aminopeptidase [Candidatus Paceibacterota bacterium]